jgi:hypothetical protein
VTGEGELQGAHPSHTTLPVDSRHRPKRTVLISLAYRAPLALKRPDWCFCADGYGVLVTTVGASLHVANRAEGRHFPAGA